MAVISPATRIAPPLNRPFHHRSTLASLHCASRNFLFLRNPSPTSTIVAVRCQKPISDGVSSMESTNHVSSVSSSIDFLTLCHRLKVCVNRNYDLQFLIFLLTSFLSLHGSRYNNCIIGFSFSQSIFQFRNWSSA